MSTGKEFALPFGGEGYRLSHGEASFLSPSIVDPAIPTSCNPETACVCERAYTRIRRLRD